MEASWTVGQFVRLRERIRFGAFKPHSRIVRSYLPVGSIGRMMVVDLEGHHLVVQFQEELEDGKLWNLAVVFYFPEFEGIQETEEPMVTALEAIYDVSGLPTVMVEVETDQVAASQERFEAQYAAAGLWADILTT